MTGKSRKPVQSEMTGIAICKSTLERRKPFLEALLDALST
jgi:hypothetical protein